MAVFFSVVSKMVSNIDIFQGIVSKLVIPVSWQHYCHQKLIKSSMLQIVPHSINATEHEI